MQGVNKLLSKNLSLQHTACTTCFLIHLARPLNQKQNIIQTRGVKMKNKFIFAISFYLIGVCLNAVSISMPKNFNPIVDNLKETKNAQKKFMKLCLKPSLSQLNTLKTIKRQAQCCIPTIPSAKGCRQMRNCYISPYEFYGVYKLRVIDSNISDLSPVQFFKSPEAMILNKNNISDVSYLSALDNIDELSLTGNPLKDISGLKNLKLYTLSINETPIKDISPLKHMTSLRTLTMGDNVTNLKPLKNLLHLRTLCITAKHKIDICQIKNLTSLMDLTVIGGDIANISCLSKLVNLTNLTLEDMPLKDISVVKNYTKLQRLTLKNIKVSNINMIRNLKNFSISLTNTKVQDLSIMTQMKNDGQHVYINSIDFRGNPLVRCSPKNDYDISHGKSCYEKNGKRKPFWKLWLGL